MRLMATFGLIACAPLLGACISGDAGWAPDLDQDMEARELRYFRATAWESGDGRIANATTAAPALFFPFALKDLDGYAGVKEDGSLGYRFEEDFVLGFWLLGGSRHWSEYDDTGRRTAYGRTTSGLLWGFSNSRTGTYVNTPLPKERVEQTWGWGLVSARGEGRLQEWSYLFGAFHSGGDPDALVE